MHEPTRDIDLLGFVLAEEPLVHETFREICGIECDDGNMIAAHSIQVGEIMNNLAQGATSRMAWT